MEDLVQISKRIRFALDQLSVLNQHHDFEHICRWIAQTKICSNILPATGPVSDGGDQGRDFETFRTYLQQSPISDSSFVGLISKKPIAFACTLTKKEKVNQKIKGDIKIITSSGTKVIDVHYFCTADVAVSNRHKLQDWAKKEYNILLEIHDGQAISEYLTDQEIFWIAVRFLGLPAEIYPETKKEDKDTRYKELLDTWKNSEEKPRSYADFFEIKTALRHVTFSKAHKCDLPFWLNLFESLLKKTPFSLLKRSAVYEISVASLRGLGSLIGHEKRLSKYFNEIQILSDVSQLEDTTVLLKYCIVAFHNNVLQLKIEDLRTWRIVLIQKMEDELRTTQLIARKCALLYLLGYVYFTSGPKLGDRTNIDKALDYWLKLTEYVENALLFPLESFADRLTQCLDIADDIFPLSNNVKFIELTQKVDELLAKRHGGFIAAEKCRDRAVALHSKGEILRAIKEIHKARINWFAEETLSGSLLSALFVSNCYHELCLAYAAKYYGLAVAYIALNARDENAKKYISRGLIDGALCDYFHGAFFSYFDFTDVGLLSFGAYSRDTDPSDPSSEINTTLFHASNVRMLAKRFMPELLGFVENRIKNWKGLEECFDDSIPLAENTWEKKNKSELWSALEKQLIGEPFSDVGKVREVSFPALGVKWLFKWVNSFNDTYLAEEFIGVLQILLADLADTDLCLLRTKVEVEIVTSEEGEISLEPIPSNTKNCWRLLLVENINQLETTLIAYAGELIFRASVLPKEQFYKRLETSLQEELSSKIFFGQRYKDLYIHFVDYEMFKKSNRSSFNKHKFQCSFNPKISTKLKWFDGPGPNYKEEDAEEVLKNRYERSIKPIKYTINKLAENTKFKETVSSLRRDGWLDWHILTAISMQAINYRINKIRKSGLIIPSDEKEIFYRYFNEEENENSEPIPISVFSEKKLRMSLKISMMSTLKGLGLENHQITPDFDAVSDFLGNRYNYWTDDIEHENYGF